jgi:hypothetical protein
MMQIMPLLHWMQVHSVVLVTAVFVMIFATTYWPGRRRRIERHGLIPLQDDR